MVKRNAFCTSTFTHSVVCPSEMQQKAPRRLETGSATSCRPAPSAWLRGLWSVLLLFLNLFNRLLFFFHNQLDLDLDNIPWIANSGVSSTVWLVDSIYCSLSLALKLDFFCLLYSNIFFVYFCKGMSKLVSCGWKFCFM